MRFALARTSHNQGTFADGVSVAEFAGIRGNLCPLPEFSRIGLQSVRNMDRHSITSFADSRTLRPDLSFVDLSFDVRQTEVNAW